MVGGTINVSEFGAKGDGITDDTAAILSAIDHCDTYDVKLLGNPRDIYLISAKIDLKNIEFDFRGAVIKFADNISAIADDVIITTGTGPGLGAFRNCAINIDGNRDNQTASVVAFQIRNDQGPLSRYQVKGYRCGTLLLVDGNSERLSVDVHASFCDLALWEKEDAGSTPDENVYNLFGANCKQWYKCSGNISSKVSFAVENNVDAGGYVLEVKTKKVVILSGEIRGTNGDGIVLNDQGSTGVCLFDNLAMLSVTGKALVVEDFAAISGNLYIEGFTEDAVTIDECPHMGGFYLTTFQSNGGASLVLDDLNVDAVEAKQTSIRGALDGKNAAGECVILKNARGVDLYLDKCTGDIRVESGVFKTTCYVNQAFVHFSFKVVNNAGEGEFSLQSRGIAQASRVLNEVTDWAFNGLAFDMVNGFNTAFEWKDTGWLTAAMYFATEAKLGSITSEVNTKFKVKGNPVYDSTNKRAVYPEAGASIDKWRDALGTVVYEPS